MVKCPGDPCKLFLQANFPKNRLSLISLKSSIWFEGERNTGNETQISKLMRSNRTSRVCETG
jgi:hypothetical protein